MSNMNVLLSEMDTTYQPFWENEYECTKSKTNNLDNVLHEINRKFISLPEDEVVRNNKILTSFLEFFIAKARTKDPLFDAMFRRVFYGGSFYDRLRVGKPEEFDLDLLFDIPAYSKPELIECGEAPGFVQLEVEELDRWLLQPEAKKYKQFREKFLDDEDFLSTVRVKNWMKSIVDQCLNDFSHEFLESDAGTFRISRREKGPAFVLHGIGTEFKMDIDLVPCFVFGRNQWPTKYFRSNPVPSTRPEFFIVPKHPKSEGSHEPRERYWRLSFQEQERELIKNKERLKPAMKLIKKMRECIPSYYVKTVFLHLLHQHDATFWNKPLSEVFMTTLREYTEFISNETIPYYWDGRNNLIGQFSTVTLQNISSRLRYIIRDVERNPHEPGRIAKYLLSKEEYAIFINKPLGATGEPELLAVDREVFTNQASEETQIKSETDKSMNWVAGTAVGAVGAVVAVAIGYLSYSASNRPRNDRTNERR